MNIRRGLKLKITRFRGDTYPDNFTIKTNGSPVDITGFSFILTLSNKENPTTESPVYSINGVIENASSGIVSFSPTTENANQPNGVYYYDVEMTDGDGKKRTLVKSTYTYNQDISK